MISTGTFQTDIAQNGTPGRQEVNGEQGISIQEVGGVERVPIQELGIYPGEVLISSIEAERRAEEL